MKERWNKRYGTEDYAYGTHPNHFFRQQISKFSPGKLFLPAEGEGRNAVYAATLGWTVDAFDWSQAGKEKSMTLARKQGVSIAYQVANAQEYPYPAEAFDAVGLFFAHMPPRVRSHLHQKCWESLKPGGVILLEAFSKDQLNYDSGGPKDLILLIDESDIHHDFPFAETLFLSSEIVTLDEGPYHQGKAAVTRFLGRKTA